MFLKARFIVPVLAVLGWLAAPCAASAGDDVKTLSVRATIESVTSLRVSSSVLRFEVTDPAAPPTIDIDFTAAARTYKGGQVLLTVESAGTLQTPNGGPSGNVRVAYEGESGSGLLAEMAQSPAARWNGSGVREGHVAFTLRGVTAPGTYLLPLKFVLSTP